MAVNITLPKLGVEMKSARINKWEKAEGDVLEQGEVALVLETDKVTYDVEAPAAGFLQIIADEGEEYQIGEVLGIIFESQAEYEAQSALPEEKLQAAAAEAKKLKASPLARKIAKDQGIDLSTLKGTGPAGAIVKKDVLAAIDAVSIENQGKTAELIPEAALSPNRQLTPQKAVKERRPLTGIRKSIAERMYASLQHTAQLTDINEYEVSPLVNFRNELAALQQITGYKISYPDLFVKMAAIVLREVPLMNASILDHEIVLWESINIGMAVALDEGLIVPVIHDADKLSLGEIHQLLADLIAKARDGKLLPDDITGGTFTITNYGSYGTYFGTPILNPPEVGILGIGAIKQKPVVKDDQIQIGMVMGCSLTVDHRLIDGEVAGRFQQKFKELLENPKLLLLK